MLCIGHRGAMGYEPENTLRSIRRALELGADWIEIDVYLVDGKLLVFHDDELSRTTNGSGMIVDQSLEYLRSLDAGLGETIPFLEEVFDLVDGTAGIKGRIRRYPSSNILILNWLKSGRSTSYLFRRSITNSLRS